MELIKALGRWLLRALYRVQVEGLENLQRAGPRALIVANHTSFLDGILLAAWLPGRPVFAINRRVAEAWWVRLGLKFVDSLALDPSHPLSVRRLIKLLKQDRHVVAFPEGRITVTGTLMKVYPGPGLVADRTQAAVVPIRIDGPQFTPFSRLRGRMRLRWFPRIRITVLPPRNLVLPPGVGSRARRQQAGALLAELMTEMMFSTTAYRRPLFEALIEAREVHGGRHVVLEDAEHRPLRFDGLITRACILGDLMVSGTATEERVGVLLPTAIATVVTFMGLHLHGRVPAMLNYTLGIPSMVSTVKTAGLRRIYTSRRFVERAGLESAVAAVAEVANVVYLEDLRAQATILVKLRGWLAARWPRVAYRRRAGAVGPDDAAVVLFTSGTEGPPKGVVLSHANILANRAQVTAKVDFTPQDLCFNALPLFHSFGLTAGTILPLLCGVPTFLYPTPLHYRIIPELAYSLGATIMFGTNTFLAGYARAAHAYDFFAVRYVFAGAERLEDSTRQTWMERFGIRIMEGYGVTETSPVLAVNTPLAYRKGSVGQLLPGIEYYLAPVEGFEQAGRLCIRGANVMTGYLLAERADEPAAPATERGQGWYDTGDIVNVDDDGFVWIQGRAKRFAKVGGEMVSLAAVETLAADVWPDHRHAALSMAHPRKGEQIVLVTEQPEAERRALVSEARAQGMGEIYVPRRVMVVDKVPLLATGKPDYPALSRWLQEEA